jgi:hypothetical protein
MGPGQLRSFEHCNF